MSERILYISKNCEHSKKLLVGLHKHGLLYHFVVNDIGKMPRDRIPPYVQSVPCLIYGNNMIKGEKLFEYLNMFAQEMLSKGDNRNVQQAIGLREERVERMNVPQQRGEPKKDNSQMNSNDLGDFEGWCDDGGCSIGFSVITESNDDHQNSKLEQTDSLFYLDHDESLKGSLNSGNLASIQSGSSNDEFQKSAKRSEMDQAYEKLMERRR